jgi:hypothetical protein
MRAAAALAGEQLPLDAAAAIAPTEPGALAAD